jgi:L,D-peptidoglycan transpeptidase YkuD (ErfK/YbiS/YcfS/YnhG family)
MLNSSHLFVTNKQLHFQGFVCDVDLGKNGLSRDKREGDLTTPVGTFPLRRLFYNPAHVQLPLTQLETYPILPDDGWCDDPCALEYNRWVKLPFPKSHETLFREDDLYDVFIEIGYNDDPVIPHKGSAIFIHSKSPSGYTHGCIALDKTDLFRILPLLMPESYIIIDEE